MARAQGARAQMALAFETTYGTPPVSGFIRMPFASATLGASQPLLNSELLGYGRDPLAPIKDALTADGDVVVPIDARAFGIWLKAAFGSPVTTGVAASGSILFGENPAPADTITLGGTVWTFVASDPGAAETEIGISLSATLAQLVADLNGSVDEEVAKCTYDAAEGTTLIIAHDAAGPDGNAFSLAASAATPSGATLAGGGYEHEFRSGSWTLPSMAIEVGMPEVPLYAMYAGCVVDQLSFSMQRAGLLTATVRLIAQGEAKAGTSAAGELEAFDLARFGHFNGAITRNGQALGNVVASEVSYANNLDRIETIRGDGLIDGADPSLAALTGRMDVRFADATLLDQAIDGDPCELAFAWSLGAGTGLTVTAHAVYLPRPRRDISGPQGVQASFEWQAARDPGEGRMCTVTLVNDVEEY